MIEEQKTKLKRCKEICKLKGTKVKESTKPNPTTHTSWFPLEHPKNIKLGVLFKFLNHKPKNH
jgi:hypothetical protein